MATPLAGKIRSLNVEEAPAATDPEDPTPTTETRKLTRRQSKIAQKEAKETTGDDEISPPSPAKVAKNETSEDVQMASEVEVASGVTEAESEVKEEEPQENRRITRPRRTKKKVEESGNTEVNLQGESWYF